MALGGIYDHGTVTIQPDRVSVFGVDTFWVPTIEVGDWLFIGSQIGLIGAIVDNTHLTLETQWQGTLPANAVYVIVKMSWLRYDPALTQSKVRELLEALNAQGTFLFVEGTEPDDAMGEDGQWALKTNITPWQLWFKVDGVWVQQAPPAGIRWRGAWSSTTTYSAADGVQHLGSSYISKTANTNQPPNLNADDWDLMAAQGGVGPPGPPGTLTDDSVTPPMLDADTLPKREAFRTRLYAAPHDALAYNGMQINGGFQVNQEYGTSGTSSVTNGYIADGWSLHNIGGAVVASATAASGGFFSGYTNHLSAQVLTPIASPASNDDVVFYQRIEGYRIARLNWGFSGGGGPRPITISFWTAHHRTGTYTGTVRNAVIDRSYAFTYTQNFSDAPEFKTITIPGCPDGVWNVGNGTGLSIVFALMSGASQIAPAANSWLAGNYLAGPGQVNAVAATSDVFRLTGLTVLPGNEAPPPERASLIMRPFGEELILCKRYFNRLVASGSGEVFAISHAWSTTSAFGFLWWLDVALRSPPGTTVPVAISAASHIGLSAANGSTAYPCTTVTAMLKNGRSVYSTDMVIGTVSLTVGAASAVMWLSGSGFLQVNDRL